MNKYAENNLERELIYRDKEFTKFFDCLGVNDRSFVRNKISHYPRKIQSIIIGLYRKELTLFLANSGLRKLTAKLDSIIPPILLNHFDSGEHELRELAQTMADKCRNYEIRGNLAKNSENPVTDSGSVLEAISVTGLNSVNETNPVTDTRLNIRLEGVYQWCASFVNDKGLKAPEVNTKQTLEGCIKRMQDRGWWLRKLRRLITKSREKVMIELGQVKRTKGIYCSDLTVVNRQHQKQQQLEMLKSLVMTNELGEQFSLHDLYEVNVSNPTLRRNELMTRMRGFEDMAKEFGNIGILITLTCPSKFHNSYSKSGDRNPKWQGLTPYDGQQYLSNTWAKMRAAFARQGIRIFGLRIAEPQHDGTPHWHMLLFVEQEQSKQFKSIIKHYSLEEDGNEKGAKEKRVDFVDIDPKKGSATGYIAKYISKNIDGANLEKGVYGEDPILAAQRVDAWASCWGIRQFQQIGGVSVTVWRELRRFRDSSVFKDKTLSELHKAADDGNWAIYTKLMGGVSCLRKSQTVRLYYKMEVNKITGLIKTSWFDGLITKKLKGLLHKGNEIITRIHTWQLAKAGTDFLPSLGVL